MLMLFFGKHGVVWIPTLDKAHFTHAADDTAGPHLNKQRVRERALRDSCTKSTSNRRNQTQRQHHSVTVVIKVQLYKDRCTSMIPIPDMLTRPEDAATQSCVCKYHSTGFLNSQAYTRQTEPFTRQTRLKPGTLTLWPVSTLLSYSGAVALLIYTGERCVHNQLSPFLLQSSIITPPTHWQLLHSSTGSSLSSFSYWGENKP